MRINNLIKTFTVSLIIGLALFLCMSSSFAIGSIKVNSGTSFDIFKIGDSLASFKSKIPQSSFRNYNLKHDNRENWNYQLINRNNKNVALSFRIENNVVRAISFHYGQSACTNSIYMPFNVNGREIVMNQTTESKMKRLFPQNEPYTYQVVGLLNLKAGIDFNFYPNQCNSKDGQDVIKTIVIFEKGNSFLFDNDSEY